MLFRTVMLISLSAISNRFDGKLFNLKSLQTKSKVQTYMLDEHLYADVMEKNAKLETKMQGVMDQMSQACYNCVLTISTKRLRQYISHGLESHTANQLSQ